MKEDEHMLGLEDFQIEELKISDFLTEELQKGSESVTKVMFPSCCCCCCCSIL